MIHTAKPWNHIVLHDPIVTNCRLPNCFMTTHVTTNLQFVHYAPKRPVVKEIAVYSISHGLRMEFRLGHIETVNAKNAIIATRTMQQTIVHDFGMAVQR